MPVVAVLFMLALGVTLALVLRNTKSDNQGEEPKRSVVSPTPTIRITPAPTLPVFVNPNRVLLPTTAPVQSQPQQQSGGSQSTTVINQPPAAVQSTQTPQQPQPTQAPIINLPLPLVDITLPIGGGIKL